MTHITCKGKRAFQSECAELNIPENAAGQLYDKLDNRACIIIGDVKLVVHRPAKPRGGHLWN